MKSRLTVCVAVAALAMTHSAAVAMPRPFKIGFAGGASVPVSNAADAFKSGFHGKAMFQWSPPVLPLGLRASVGYERLSLKSLTPGVDGTGKILSGVGNFTYGFPVGPLKPYLIAGVGAFNMKTEVGGTTSPSQTKFGIDAGAGLEFKLGGIAGFVEGKVENIFTDQGFTGPGSTQDVKTMIVPVTFGVFF
jgi:opacity protein-like surface antigen